jgi:lactoylglutathione lyase
MNLNFRGTRLLVDNYESCIDFYQKILGFELIYQDNNQEEADLKMGDTRLNLIKRQTMAAIIGSTSELPGDNTGKNAGDNIALIFTTQNLDQTCDTLQARNVTFITKPTYRPQWGIKTIYLRDPDENLIGIYELTDEIAI